MRENPSAKDEEIPFSFFLTTKLTGINKNIYNLFEDLQNSLSKYDYTNDEIIKRYLSLNYFARFSDCLQTLLQSSNDKQRDQLLEKAKTLRQFLMHKLAFFTNQPLLTDKFIINCKTILTHATLATTRSISYALNKMLEEVLTDEVYLKFSTIHTQPLRESADILSAKNMLLEIYAILQNIHYIINHLKDQKNPSVAETHAMATLHSYYWELVTHYYEFSKPKAKHTSNDFKQYLLCLSVLSSHPDQINKNALTAFTKPFRNHIFAHAAYWMLDGNKKYVTSLKEIKLYDQSLHPPGEPAFTSNQAMLFEYAEKSKEYISALEKICPDIFRQIQNAVLEVKSTAANFDH